MGCSTAQHSVFLSFDTPYRLVFQNLLMESDPAVLSCSQDAWTALLSAASSANFATAASPQLTSMLFDLACTPTGHMLLPKCLLRFPMPASSDGLLPPGSRPGAIKHMLGVEEGFDVAKMRLAAAGALGQLACKFVASGTWLHPPLCTHRPQSDCCVGSCQSHVAWQTSPCSCSSEHTT